MKTSIIITSYNYENYIAEAIESVIAQTVLDWELVIVDDGSSDNSVEIIKQYCKKDDRIKLYTHPDRKNHGLCASVKLGLEKAQNDWVAFLESDDFFAPNYLEEKIKILKKYTDCVFLYNNVNLIGSKEVIIHQEAYLKSLEEFWEKEDLKDVFDDFFTKNIVPTFSCVMCKKSVLEECNFDSPAVVIIDYWLWWQIAEKHKLCFVNKKLTNWRIHNDSYLKEATKTIKNHFERSLFMPRIVKLFKRKTKPTVKILIKSNLFISIVMYFYIYLKRKLPRPIENIIQFIEF